MEPESCVEEQAGGEIYFKSYSEATHFDVTLKSSLGLMYLTSVLVHFLLL
jgi:hypothetical protein